MGGWLEILYGFARLLLQPLFYWFFIYIIFISTSRIRKERKMFGTRAFDIFSEWQGTWRIGLIAGIVLSIISVGLGFVFPYPLVMVLTVTTILLYLMTKLNWLSAAYTFGTSCLLIIIMGTVEFTFLPLDWKEMAESVSLTGITLVMSVLLVVEALWLIRMKQNKAFPEMVTSSRGKRVGQHRLKRIGMVPCFVLIPGGAITAFAPWWPLFDLGGGSYGLMLVPFLTGFDWNAKGQPPEYAAKWIGSRLLVLALAAGGLAIGSYWQEWLTAASIVLAVAGREFLKLLYRSKAKKRTIFVANDSGLPVIGIIPGSPADKIGLLVGEHIERINQMRVTNEEEFYHALQKNRALCKMEIRDEQGELRFIQRSMYEDEHYELGILFPKSRIKGEKATN
ncbi:PDZ domain-containing protein [Thalassobacillus pellis]|uniref:PDZ domain-containing protein n=1 Tax=Thalassobacillus pellis TaxID=748008 RepID=UPI00195FD161|nr:PDZ domain-containing protein [Thalassobacillus pellis]MBM7551413.1 hypothetical protein [Thalassobacillus pellis]